MASLHIKLTKDILTVLKWINVREVPVIDLEAKNKEELLEETLYQRSPFGGEFVYEDIAGILGYQEYAIPETIEDPDGIKYEDSKMEYMKEIYIYIVEHFTEIEEIVHQFATSGVKCGNYKAPRSLHIWEFIGE